MFQVSILAWDLIYRLFRGLLDSFLQDAWEFRFSFRAVITSNPGEENAGEYQSSLQLWQVCSSLICAQLQSCPRLCWGFQRIKTDLLLGFMLWDSWFSSFWLFSPSWTESFSACLGVLSSPGWSCTHSSVLLSLVTQNQEGPFHLWVPASLFGYVGVHFPFLPG